MHLPQINVEEKLRSVSPGVSGLVLLSAVGSSFERLQERAYERMLDRMYRQGETEESLLQKVEALPIPPQFKDQICQHVEGIAGRPAIEVESTVEEV